MPSVDDDFDELVRKIEKGRDFTSASFEPVYYLVFDPAKIIEVKRKLAPWNTRLKQKNFEPHFFSIADAIAEIHSQFPLRKIWLNADEQSPLAWDKVNNSMRVALEKNKSSESPLQEKLEEKLASLEGHPRSILIVTDLEALHPYLRIGAIESQLLSLIHI